jgi:hypothetical protein
MMKIPLTQGQVALVDDRDYRRLSAFKWYAHKGKGRFYAARREGGKSPGFIHMHRMILPASRLLVIDHINGNPLDNRRRNLRACTFQQNLVNSPARGGSSVYKGVSKHRKKWQLQLRKGGKLQYLGLFASEVQAAKRYDDAAKEAWGEFAWLNFPHRLKRSNIRRWLGATRGRVFSVTFIRRSDGLERTILGRVGVFKGTKGRPMPYRPGQCKLMVVYDMNARQHKTIPVDGIEAVRFGGKRYRVD